MLGLKRSLVETYWFIWIIPIQGRFFVHYFFVIKCLLWLFVVVISEVNSGRIRLVDCSGCCIKTLRPADVKHYSASWVQLIVRNMIASDWDSLRVLSSCHLHTDVSYFCTNKTMLLVFFWMKKQKPKHKMVSKEKLWSKSTDWFENEICIDILMELLLY